jgi:hypothetical protein
MRRLRLTVLYEFDYHGEVDETTMTRLINNFAADPTGFLHPRELEIDETLIVDLEDVTDGD